MKISRRTMLASLGGVAAGAAAWRGWAQGVEDAGALLEEWRDYEEQWRVTICRQCPGGCGLLARVVDGEVVRLVGNPLHPVNRGGMCVKGLAGTQVLYDPDRIKSPLKRSGPRGEGRWQPISWEAALKELTARLWRLRAEGRPEALALLGGQYRGLTDSLFQRFCDGYGTPNYLRYRCLTPEKATAAQVYQQGLTEPLCFDLDNSRYILSFGCNLLESWLSTVHQQWAYGRFRQRAEGERARLVQVDSRLSVTGAKAHQWIPVKPGTDGALALGLAYVIIQERLYDRDFVQGMTFGFEDWKDSRGVTHMGFRRLVLEEYAPEQVSAITGVPVETLFQVARDFAAARPALAIGERGPAFHPNDLYTRMAIHSLNALVGSIGVKGGAFVQGDLPLTPWEQAKPDAVAREGLGRPRVDRSAEGLPLPGVYDIGRLPRAITEGSPYPLDTLMVYYTDPLYSLPGRGRWLEALRKIPYLVSFSPFMDETSQQADLILPDHTYLERWQDDQITHLAGVSAVSIGRPVVPPRQDTRQTEDAVLQIAQALGEGTAAALPWENYEALLFEKAQGLYEAGRGHVVMPPQEEAFEEILTRQGYWMEQFESFDDFWDALLLKGAWWDPHDSFFGVRQLIRTPSGKFEFYAQNLRKALLQAGRNNSGANTAKEEEALERAALALQIQATGDRLFLPHFEQKTPAGEDAEYPFHLNTYKLLSHAGGRGANQPWLQQQPAVHVDAGWESWVEINPETAAAYGVADGDAVWLESSKGRIKVKTRLYPGAMPNVLNMPFGQGHRAYGRWATGRGENPNDIINDTPDLLRGLPVWGATRVRLVRA